jgi:hypothetical protein
MTQTNRYSAKLVLSLLFIVLFVFFLYTFLHEAGHALVGLLFGQSLTEFNVNFWDLSAHVGMTGGELTPSQLALRSAAGVTLPLLIWMIFISLVPRKASFIVETLKLVSSMTAINTLLPWVILPIVFILGKAPSDDVTNFLRYSQMYPPLLIIIALVLYISEWILFLSKINGLRNEFFLFRRTDRGELPAERRATIPVMASIMAFCLIVTLALNGFAATNLPNKFSPPPGFVPVAQIDLSTRAYPSETLTRFSLDKPTYVGVFIAVHNINTTYFDLSITGSDGYSSIVLHGEGYNAFQDGGLWEENLSPGTYQLVITSHQSPGAASVYLKIR